MALPASTATQPSPSATAEQPVQGTESLRSSDEFPSNKENNHGGPPGGTRLSLAAGKQSVHAHDSSDADVVSEHIMAQEAMYALQVMTFTLNMRVWP